MYSHNTLILCSVESISNIGAIQVLRNADRGGGGSNFPNNSVTKVYGLTLLAL